MDLQLINTLSESKMFRTKDALDRYSDKEKDELFYAYTISLLALFDEKKTKAWAQKYAAKTMAFNNFRYFRISSTDLYLLAYDVFSRHTYATIKREYIIVLKKLGTGVAKQSQIEKLMFRLERMLKINNSRLRNARRELVMLTGSRSSQEAAMRDLYRFIKSNSATAEILPYLLIPGKSEPGYFGTAIKVAIPVAVGIAAFSSGLRGSK